MNSALQNIIINATYEIKILLRSWFFRLFAISSLLTLVGLDILFYSTVSPVPRFFRGIDSFMPYMNVLLPHFSQLIVAVFLATDLYKRDKKYNTADVINIRNMSNFSFIFGRALGVMGLFLVFDYLLLALAAIINLFFSDLALVWQVYLLYPLLITLPSLVFTIGLTLFLMQLIRNQPVTIILILGVLAGSIFYFNNYAYLTFDIIPAVLPMAYSDFMGFSNTNLIILQRAGWFLCGFFFLFWGILLSKRLPQSPMATNILKVLVVILPVVSFGLLYNFYSYYSDGVELRAKTKAQLVDFESSNSLSILAYDIDLKHQGKQISAYAGLQITNKSETPVDTLQLLLNPGLHISDITLRDEGIDFNQNGVIVNIIPNIALFPADTLSLIINYAGSIDDRIAAEKILEKDRLQTHFIWLFRMETRYAFVEPNYVLLPPSILWYPQSNSPNARDLAKPFANFNLKVATKSVLTAISQGFIDSIQAGVFAFKNEQPLKEISLHIGNYKEKRIKTENFELNFYTHPDHNYYQEFFKEIGDTLPTIIQEIVEGFETKIDLDYPFKRLTVIEVPIHSYANQRNNRDNADFLQAEQVWLPENAVILTSSDFKMQQERQSRFGNRSNQTFTDLEKEIILFRRFANNTFTGNEGWGFGDDINSFKPDLTIYPLFLNFSFAIEDTVENGFTIALESNLKQTAKPGDRRRRWAVGELTNMEEANLALAEANLKTIFKKAKMGLLNKVLVAKGSYLLKQIQYELGKEDFTKFMNNLITENHFKSVNVADIAIELKNQYNFDLNQTLQNWLQESQLPGFQFSNMEFYQVRDGERLRYQVIFKVYNPTEIDGLLELEFMYPGEGRGFNMEQSTESEKWLYKIEGGLAKSIAIVLDSEPRALSVNTLVSQNLPGIYTFRFEDAELKPGKTASDGSHEISWIDYTNNTGSLIADDANQGFEYVHPQYRSRLKAWIHKDAEAEELEYDYFRFWRGPTQWSKLKFPSFNGELVHSAYYARSGSGERTASWETDIPEDGYYQVYVHVPDPSDFRMGRHERKYFGVQRYKVFHSEGEDEIEIDFSNAQPGWNYLETYYFRQGTARIELNDDTSGSMVLADAVKWELKE